MEKNLRKTVGIEEHTPLVMMTLGQLLDALSLASREKGQEVKEAKHYVHGLRGIQSLFGVSHKTAQQYKNGWLAPACMQAGRKIVVDADMAMELFRNRRGRHEK